MSPTPQKLEIAGGRIAKLDHEQRLAFGWASVARKDGAVPLGWWVGFKVEDDQVWEAVKLLDLRGGDMADGLGCFLRRFQGFGDMAETLVEGLDAMEKGRGPEEATYGA